jgi:hypothetical protein
MSLFGFIRVGMKKEGVEAKIKEVELKECKEEMKEKKATTPNTRKDQEK